MLTESHSRVGLAIYRNETFIILRTIVTAAAIAVLALSTAADADQQDAESAETGTVVVAKASGAAIVIWDATPFVAQLVSQKNSGDEGLKVMKSRALVILINKARNLNNAQSITINATYTKSGEVSPVYGSATFAGVERVFSIMASREDLLRLSRESHAASEAVPSNFKLIVSGRLPPSN